MGANTFMYTTNHFIRDGIRNLGDSIREIFRFLCDGIVLFLRIFPRESLSKCLCFGERKVFLGNGFVVSKGREFWGKEFTICVDSTFLIDIGHIHHVLFNLGEEYFVLLFCILFVQNAILLISNANAGETMGA